LRDIINDRLGRILVSAMDSDILRLASNFRSESDRVRWTRSCIVEKCWTYCNANEQGR